MNKKKKPSPKSKKPTRKKQSCKIPNDEYFIGPCEMEKIDRVREVVEFVDNPHDAREVIERLEKKFPKPPSFPDLPDLSKYLIDPFKSIEALRNIPKPNFKPGGTPKGHSILDDLDKTIEKMIKPDSAVNHPLHYGGDTIYEAIKVIKAWNLGFELGNTVKYISRAGKKDPSKEIEDLEKALWYLDYRIKDLKSKKSNNFAKAE